MDLRSFASGAFSLALLLVLQSPAQVRVGTFHIHSPYGIAMVLDNETAFLLNPELEEGLETSR